MESYTAAREGRSTERETAMVDTSAPAANVEAVSRVATEYFQSWFAGDGERMRACLHPALAKRTPEQPGIVNALYYVLV